MKYRESGCAKISPDTLAAGVIAYDSVSAMPSSSASEQLEQLPLLAVVGAGRVAQRRADAAEPLRVQVLQHRLGVRLEPVAARLQVDVLGERLGEPVGQRLDHDRAVVVLLGLVLRGQVVGAVDGDREAAEVVALGGDVVGEAAVRAVRRLRRSAAAASGTGRARSRRRAGCRRPRVCAGQNAYAPFAVKLPSAMISSSSVFASSNSSRATGCVQDRRVLALELPGQEQELPVDHLAQLGDARLDDADAGERRRRQVVERHLLAGSPGPARA